MAKVITFSRLFPSYHLRKGQQTYFVEKILKEWGVDYLHDNYLQKLLDLNAQKIALGKLTFEDVESFYLSLKATTTTKGHTIRTGNRFKDGDCFSPRCWFGRPYFEPQIIFWDDVEVKKTYPFELTKDEYLLNGKKLNLTQLTEVANNDGLSSEDLELWFQKPFAGQVICWDDKIDY